MKNLDWNAALQEETEFEHAVKTSEVFRGFVKQMAKLAEQEKESCVKQPLMRNKDYIETEEKELIDDDLMALAQLEEEFTEDLEEEFPDEPEPAPESEVLDDYNTGAGESDFIDIGVTSETMAEMEKGIDYADAPVETAPESEENLGEAVVEVMDVYNKDKEEELDEIEKKLGLDLNEAYLISKILR